MNTLTLNLVSDLGSGSEFYDSISDSDVVNGWPGTPVTIDLTVPPLVVRPVWIGVSTDGTSTKPFPITTSVPDIIGAGWPRVYQGTQIQLANGEVEIFSNQFAHVQAAMASCCGSEIVTGAYGLKQSIYSLAFDQPPPPCGAEAIFKWLAVYGSAEETPDMTVNFTVNFIDAGFTFNLTEQFLSQPFTETLQIVKSWPADFIGMTIAGKTLVSNDTTPGPDDIQVRDLTGGSIGVSVSILDGSDQVIKSVFNEFLLPGTDCGETSESSGSGGSEGIFGSEFSEQFS